MPGELTDLLSRIIKSQDVGTLEAILLRHYLSLSVEPSRGFVDH